MKLSKEIIEQICESLKQEALSNQITDERDQFEYELGVWEVVKIEYSVDAIDWTFSLLDVQLLNQDNDNMITKTDIKRIKEELESLIVD